MGRQGTRNAIPGAFVRVLFARIHAKFAEEAFWGYGVRWRPLKSSPRRSARGNEGNLRVGRSQRRSPGRRRTLRDLRRQGFLQQPRPCRPGRGVSPLPGQDLDRGDEAGLHRPGEDAEQQVSVTVVRIAAGRTDRRVSSIARVRYLDRRTMTTNQGVRRNGVHRKERVREDFQRSRSARPIAGIAHPVAGGEGGAAS